MHVCPHTLGTSARETDSIQVIMFAKIPTRSVVYWVTP